MTRREAKRYALGLAAGWIRADVDRASLLEEADGILTTERDRQRIQDALREVADELDRRATRTLGAG